MNITGTTRKSRSQKDFFSHRDHREHREKIFLLCVLCVLCGKNILPENGKISRFNNWE